MYLLTAIGLTPGGSSTVHIYTTQTVHRTTQNKQYIEEHNNLWECGPCPVLARFTLTFALQLRKKHGKNLIQGSRGYGRVIVAVTISLKWAMITLLNNGLKFEKTEKILVEMNTYPPGGKIKPSFMSR